MVETNLAYNESKIELTKTDTARGKLHNEDQNIQMIHNKKQLVEQIYILTLFNVMKK